jgi:hypothetical protein
MFNFLYYKLGIVFYTKWASILNGSHHPNGQ